MRCDALRAVSCAPGESRAEVGQKWGGSQAAARIRLSFRTALCGDTPFGARGLRAGFAASAGTSAAVCAFSAGSSAGT